MSTRFETARQKTTFILSYDQGLFIIKLLMKSTKMEFCQTLEARWHALDLK